MGNCIYCGKPAGFLHSQHKECRQVHDEAAAKIPEFFVEALNSSMEPAHFRSMTQEIARKNFIADNELHGLEVKGIQNMIAAACSNEAELTDENEKRIANLSNIFDITANDLGEPGMRLAKARILRRLDEGKYPENVQFGQLPVNLKSDERPIWLYNNATYYRMRNRTRYVGSSHGVSIRLMKGLYYRVGAYRGETNPNGIFGRRRTWSVAAHKPKRLLLVSAKDG